MIEEIEPTTSSLNDDDNNNNNNSAGNSVVNNQDDNLTTVVYRDSTERPVFKLSVRLIHTYKQINNIYYETKAKKLRDQQADSSRGGVHNEGYDDQHYDYILKGDEIFAERYILKHKVGRGSFGQVVCAYDQELRCEVAIKIIKSRKPFTLQAQIEIELLQLMGDVDVNDEYNIVKLLDRFVYRNHQCLVFEMLSYNLYDLLRNTRFRGVSLNLIRKFSKAILKSLEYLSSPSVNIIHCDLKPENILLRHPRRSSIKLIDFGSSCIATKRTYTYIQSRFYRSPEILLGLPYDQKIDIWSLGCVLVELHTGEPLFGGTDQVDQMCRIVELLGMLPVEMIDLSPLKTREQFFEKIIITAENSNIITFDPSCMCKLLDGSAYYKLKRTLSAQKDGKIIDKTVRSLTEIIGVNSGGPHGRRLGETGHSVDNYIEFESFIRSLLIYNPSERCSAYEASLHSLFDLSSQEIEKNDNNVQIAKDPNIISTSSLTNSTTTTKPDETTSNTNTTISTTEPNSDTTVSSSEASLQLNTSKTKALKLNFEDEDNSDRRRGRVETADSSLKTR
jgi:dual specificity tyrosine-phosphorylation-regulated kinase 1